MHPDVDWPNGMDGGRELGHEAVRAYWTRQFGLIDSHVEPVGFSPDDEGRVVVDVDSRCEISTARCSPSSACSYVYTLRNGLIARMDIR